MYFKTRDRVKCISASDGVPVSMQWEAQGYYYPTQIAQFGLSHYSKNLTDPEPRRKVNRFMLHFFSKEIYKRLIFCDILHFSTDNRKW